MAKTRRDEIIRAARTLMRDRGYAGTAMKDVAEQVGLLTGSLYAHFAGKDALVPEVLALTFHETTSGFETTGDWQRDYGAALDRVMAFLAAGKRCLGLQLAYGTRDDDGPAGAAIHKFFADLAGFLADCLPRDWDHRQRDALSRRALARLEGATLWLVLDDDDGPLISARREAMAEALYAASPFGASAQEGAGADDPEAEAVLKRMGFSWGAANGLERALAERLAAAEGDLAVLQGQRAAAAEGESCFTNAS